VTQALDAVSRVSDLESFRPSAEQQRAKARLHARLRERAEVVDLASLTADEVATLAGNRRVLTWLRDPGFAAWLADKDTFATNALAMRELAVQVIGEVLLSDYEPKVLTAKDKLKAADMLLQLTAAYPAKQREVRFLDKDLDAMPPDQVQAELRKLRAGLVATLPPDTESTDSNT
jgi:hypothetical protein